MGKSMKDADAGRKSRRSILWLVMAALLAVLISVFAFLRFYSAYIDKTLYAERLSQMREVTTQLFAGLEDVMNNQWRTASEQCRTLQREKPQTMDGLMDFLQDQAVLGELADIQCDIIAVDNLGVYYTQEGRQGLIGEREYLLSSSERVSYVSNSLISDETRMVFLQRLEEPVTVENGGQQTTLIYYGISQNMEELNPYFECSAYNGNNSVYVVDEAGLRLFSSNGDGLLKGFNIYHILEGMEYLHGSSFDLARKELEVENIAYSNAVINDTEVYYALYRMENAEWTLIFLVPSAYVATNTVVLVNTTIRMVLIFAVLLVIFSAAAIFWLMRMQQRAALEVERRNNAQLERINEELAAAVEVAEKATKAKSDFLANMSHDIRTPMNAIVGITNLMEHEADASDKLHTYIQKVQLSSRHLLSLINDILDMSKIESSEVALNQDSISLAEQVGQVDSIIRSQTAERGQTFVIRTHHVVHEYLIGDGVRLRQIFLNLLSNAVKYTPYGGAIRFELEELPCPQPEHATFHITVEDNGYGMEEAFVKHIFEPFTRGESSMTNKVQGTGLGMAITKNIVDLMGGTITVRSTVDRGSCFDVTLTFPIDDSVKNQVSVESLLLIAEEKELTGNLQAVLQEAGVSFFAASSEKQAEEVLQAQRVEAFEQVKPGDYDAVLLDIQMPRMNGLEASRTIRGGSNPLGQTIPIIAMTANAFTEDIRDCLNAGMDAHVSKPIDIAVLERTLRNLMAENAGGAKPGNRGWYRLNRKTLKMVERTVVHLSEKS